MVSKSRAEEEQNRYDCNPAGQQVDDLGNYVVEAGQLYLVDWDEIDLSDPWRDGGIQLWWHVPAQRWAELVAGQGAVLDGALEARILWWTSFKMQRNGHWVDLYGGSALAELNARAFLRAMAGLRPA